MQRSKKQSTPKRDRRATDAWQPWLWGAALVLLVVVVYWPTLANGFIWDDDDYVENNPTLLSLRGLWNIWFKLGALPQYYPAAHSTYWIEHRLWGLDPRGYHLVNLLLHAASVLLAWRLLARLKVPGAWLAAAIFAVHPVEVESVAWIAERKNLLSCVFALGSLLVYLKFSPADAPAKALAEIPRERWRFYAASMALYCVAVLSKTVTASAPAVLLVIYWWKRGRITRQDALWLAPFFAFGLVASALTVWVEKTQVMEGRVDWDLTPVDRVLIAGRALWFYAGKIVWPRPLVFFYPRFSVDAGQPWQYLYPLAALAVLVVLWRLRGRIGRGPLAAVLIFAGVLLPALGFFDVYPFRYSFVADHFQYHASIALIALVAAALVGSARRLVPRMNWVAIVAGVGLIAALALVARERTAVYHDRTTLHENTFALNPEAWVAPQDLANYLRDQGQPDRAIPYCHQAIASLEGLARDYPAEQADYQDKLAGSHADLGLAQQRLGYFAAAEASYRTSIELRRQLVEQHPETERFAEMLAFSYDGLASVERANAKPGDAEVSYRKAMAIREQLAKDHPAIGRYRNEVAANQVDIGLLRLTARRAAEAADWFQQALKLRAVLVREDPSKSEYQDGLAWCYVDLALADRELGKTDDAEFAFAKAISIREQFMQDDPTSRAYRSRLGALYVDSGLLERDLGHPKEAARLFGKSVEVRQALLKDYPASVDAQVGLGWSYAHQGAAQLELGNVAAAIAAIEGSIRVRQKLVDSYPFNDQYRLVLENAQAQLTAAQARLGP